MRKVFILGDSHIAAIEKGWVALQPEFPDIEITFLATPGQRGRGFAVSDGRLVAGDDALKGFFRRAKIQDATVGSGFDLYLLCGLGLQINQFPQARVAFVQALRNGAEAGARDDLFRNALESLRHSTCGQTLTKLRSVIDAPVGIIPPPMPGALALKPGIAALLKRDVNNLFIKTFLAACDALARENSATFIPQPVETLGDNPGITKASFGASPVKFFVYDLKEDGRHMNVSYGEIVLRNALKTMLPGLM